MAGHDSAGILEDLFAHQVQPKYRYCHDWTPGDVMAFDNFRTLHRAVANYHPSERRLLRRCQVMADQVYATRP